MFLAEKPVTQDDTAIAPPRAYALDALRGLAILAMVFSGTIRYKILPAWMYHAQEPPPTHALDKTLAGLTWVDVVFPVFLFAMGAAIPLALSRRIAEGWSWQRIIFYVLKRGALLGAFAIILQHLRPSTINAEPTPATWKAALFGFVLLCLMFGRLPASWKLSRYRLWITVSGWIACLIMISQLSYGGEGFLLTRSDPILMVLANMSVFGSLAWLMTRSNWQLRTGLLGLLIALQFASSSAGWVQQLWRFSPAPWIFQFYYWKYLFVVIPGTIAGDIILRSAQSKKILSDIDFGNVSGNASGSALEEVASRSWSQQQLFQIGVSMLVLCLVLLVGLQARWVWQTVVISGILCLVISLLFKHPNHVLEQQLQQFYQWGVYWLALGLCFEPFQEGIKKTPSTYSYYFITTAIALFLLITFTILSQYFRQQGWFQLLVENGQNPMIAYVAFANLLWPILELSGIEAWVLEHTATPIMGVIKGVVYTLPIALLTSFLTRRKFFWKT